MSHNRTHTISRILLTGAVATLAFAVAPGTAHASTAKAVEVVVATKTAPGQPKFGESGPAVVALQTAIMRNGFSLKGGASGKFDRRTRLVLRNFQKVVGLKVTGKVDAATAGVLKLNVATTTVAPATTAAPAPTVPPAPAPTVAPVAYALNPAALPIRGNRGEAVLALQKALVAAGLQVRGGVDGIFGSGTTQTLAAFQSAKGLPATGLLDANTAATLGLIAPTTTVAPAPTAAPAVQAASVTVTTLPSRGTRGNDVVIIQSALIKAGIPVKGGVDGIFGGATTVAIQRFQAANGLPTTGRMDTRTAIKLGVMAAPAIQLDVFPMQGPCSFSNTWHAPRGNGRLHLGVDIIAKEGNLLYAVTDGTITKIYNEANDKLAGNGIRLTKADGTYFFYGHMLRLADGITIGTQVKAGQVVGYNGKTGGTNTPHLHFEIHSFGGAAIDPTAAVDAVNACGVTTPLPVPAA
jgi:peptidoglycan hydrolase-like protein with peptidoglycan-binding domain